MLSCIVAIISLVIISSVMIALLNESGWLYSSLLIFLLFIMPFAIPILVIVVCREYLQKKKYLVPIISTVVTFIGFIISQIYELSYKSSYTTLRILKAYCIIYMELGIVTSIIMLFMIIYYIFKNKRKSKEIHDKEELINNENKKIVINNEIKDLEPVVLNSSDKEV